MFTERKRVLWLITIAAAMNTVLFLVAYFTNLPLWLDTTGTIYVSYLLGFPAGFIVAIVNTGFQALFFFGEDSLLFYFVSGLTAFVTGKVLKKYGATKVKKWVLLTVYLIFASGIAAVLITFIANKGIPANEISQELYYYLNARGWNGALASAFAVLLVKIPDIVVSVLICPLAAKLTPRKLKTREIAIMKE